MRHSTWIAIGIAAAVTAWLASGFVLGQDEAPPEEEAAAAAPQPMLVAVRSSEAETVPQYIYAQGVAEPYRTADVISSTGGTLSAVPVEQGDEVEAERVVARVRLEARESELASAEAAVERLEADLQAVERLRSRGFATEARVRELRAQLKEARAVLEGVRSEIGDTHIEAPIPGIVSDVFVNAGETVQAGTGILRIVDNAPLRVTINVSQRDVGSVDVGRQALVSFATGALAKGRVCYVAPAAAPETRTFRVEIRVPNEEREIPSVVSAEVRFQTGEAEAHFVSPAILTLNDAGELGVKSVNADNVVNFHAVEMVRAGMDGAWIAGLPEELRLITVGQGFVREGERVRVQEAPADEETPAGGEAQPGGAGRAPLPTYTVEDEAFDGAEALAAPPPAESLCRGGAAANAMATSAVPSGGGAAPAQGADPGTQPGGGAAGRQGAPAAGADGRTGGAGGGAGAGGVPQGAPGETAPISPEVPAPPIEQAPPGMPGGGQQPDQGAPGGAPEAGMGGGAPGTSGAGDGAGGGTP